MAGEFESIRGRNNEGIVSEAQKMSCSGGSRSLKMFYLWGRRRLYLCINNNLFWILGTSHDWRLRCGAVDLYFTLFGLSRPSCLPLPELGLVLNLKEKKAVLNPTIIPESVANNQEPVNSTNNHGQSVGFQNTVRQTICVDPIQLALSACIGCWFNFVLCLSFSCFA